ncbi:MAG: ABC transporter permease, partial [Clostridia bacterium]|nr:ABC transporter permease [Clostridia bacterium]
MNILHKVTAKILKHNKVRTGVTIIGILLSAAMFTAVTTCVSSVQNFLFRTAVATDGNWHGVLYNADFSNKYSVLYNNGKTLREEIEGYTSLDHIGYAMAGSTNEYKPYLMVYGVDSKVEDYLPIHLIDGRMPQNSGEILLPAHLQTNGEVEHQLGDTLVLNLGERRFEGAAMNQQNPYQPGEELIAKDSRIYTVVGFYRRPRFEQYYSPGYSALTVADPSAERADIYLRTKNPRDIYALLEG